MGGKCITGAKILVKKARTKNGTLVGSNAIGPYGTPKCEFITMLLKCNEPENQAIGGCWVSAHPSLGEICAKNIIMKGLMNNIFGVKYITKIQSEVRNIADTNMRCDFVVSTSIMDSDGREKNQRFVVECKQVVDTDYDISLTPTPTHTNNKKPKDTQDTTQEEQETQHLENHAPGKPGILHS